MSDSLVYFQILGTGASLGVPVIGCGCATCKSPLKENKRSRTAALLTYKNKKILIDAGTDFREQALQYQINQIDGLIITHSHNDHIAGLDDLRAFFLTRTIPIPCLMSKETHQDLKHRYPYIFDNKKTESMIPQFSVKELQNERGELVFEGIKLKYFTYVQQGMSVLGLRFGDFAFVTDIKKYDETIFEDLQGVKTLVISALRFTSSTMHFTVDEAIAFSKKVKAQNTYLTHMAHEIEYETASQKLPEGVFLAYDGLTISLKGSIDG
jgi:phosphoribosyl 1,2-cyclic phosphate phosphodiesterase